MSKNRETADHNIEKVIDLCNELINLTDIDGDYHLDDDSMVFYNALRDASYKIRRMAKNEKVRQETIG